MNTLCRFVFADALGLQVTVVNATAVNISIISWVNETLQNNNSTDIVQQNTSSFILQFRYYSVFLFAFCLYYCSI